MMPPAVYRLCMRQASRRYALNLAGVALLHTRHDSNNCTISFFGESKQIPTRRKQPRRRKRSTAPPDRALPCDSRRRKPSEAPNEKATMPPSEAHHGPDGDTARLVSKLAGARADAGEYSDSVGGNSARQAEPQRPREDELAAQWRETSQFRSLKTGSTPIPGLEKPMG